MLASKKTTSLSLALGLLGSSALVAAPQGEWEADSPYYEDDAWFDVTEWFDGNDYNPTDEKVFRWDDEIYGNDWKYDRTYGFAGDNEDDDWFYDYYGGTYLDYYGNNDVGSRSFAYYYYDFDNDGLYDAFNYYYDSNNDGTYDGIEYYPIYSDSDDSAGTRNASAGDSDSRHADSTAHSVSGEIEKVKKVELRGGKNLVVMLKGDEKAAIDLGSAEKLTESVAVEPGTKIEALGPMSKVGDKNVLFAQHLTVDGKTHEIERNPMELEGVIADTRKTEVRGTERMFVILTNGADKKWLVDLGPAKAISADLAPGQELSVEGIPCKQKDRRILVATACERDGHEIELDRYLTRQDRDED